MKIFSEYLRTVVCRHCGCDYHLDDGDRHEARNLKPLYDSQITIGVYFVQENCLRNPKNATKKSQLQIQPTATQSAGMSNLSITTRMIIIFVSSIQSC